MKIDYNYCNSFTEYSRHNTQEVVIGNKALGGNHPIRLQSMTNTNTNDIEATAEQCINIIDAGADYVRITAQGIKEAEALNEIKQILKKRGYNNPLVADIHFNPQAAMIAAKYVEKIRINPGNYVDKRTIEKTKFTEEEYLLEIKKIHENLKPLLSVCKTHNTAIRIGVNHGSLSGRILSKYGNTELGMVESMMEFLRICKKEKFYNIVVSLKASNTRIMVHSCRLLVKTMNNEGMNFPIHLGVTEAGSGEDGRIRSALGIGALLLDGIGDTIRVSLTEDPELEIPVAKKISDYCTSKQGHEAILIDDVCHKNPYKYIENKSSSEFQRFSKPVTVIDISNLKNKGLKPDFVIAPIFFNNMNKDIGQIIPILSWKDYKNTFPLFNADNYFKIKNKSDELNFLKISTAQLERLSERIKNDKNTVILLESNNSNPSADFRASIYELINRNIHIPIIPVFKYDENCIENLQIKAACDASYLCIDNLINGIYLENLGDIDNEEIVNIAYGILQASGLRYTKTEFISCPSCGRTLFDIQLAIKDVKEKTGHLKGLKIAVMGCIVNGPGEMADADYGYIGAGFGKINLYKNQVLIKKNIDSSLAVDELIELIKENGDWVYPNN